VDTWFNCSGFPALKYSGEPIVFGRSRSCDFHLPHESVSRKHAWIGVKNRQLVIENQSSQSLLLNDEPIEGPTPIQIGDRLRIGPYVVRVSDTPEFVEDLESETTTALDFEELKAAAEAKKQLADAEAERERLEFEIKRARKELESEVWRGLDTHREKVAAQKELESLKDRLAKLTARIGSESPTTKHARRPMPVRRRPVRRGRPGARRRPARGRPGPQRRPGPTRGRPGPQRRPGP